MTKSELIAIIAQKNPHLSSHEVIRIVSTVFEEITNALAKGKRVEIRGFGTFSTKKRAGRTGRNPRTGKSVQVSAKIVPAFKTGKKLKELINQ